MVGETKKLAANSTDDGTMTLYFGRIRSETDKMVNVLNAEAGIAIETVRLDKDGLTQSVTSSVRSSITRTFTASTGSSHSHSSEKGTLKQYKVDATVPTPATWTGMKSATVAVYKTVPITSTEDLKKPIRSGEWATQQGVMHMKRAPDPFAEGACRLAYYGQLADDGLLRPQQDPLLVLKTFKCKGKEANELKHYLKQMEITNVARFLAEKYNDSDHRPPHCAKVDFLPCCVVEESFGELDDDDDDCHGKRRYCAEPSLPDASDGSKAAFLKFCNNTGYWNSDHLDESLLRFSAYTHHVTDGYIMVADLQGVKTSEGSFLLTDPVVLCSNLVRFGNTNLGPKFMKRCLNAVRALRKERCWE